MTFPVNPFLQHFMRRYRRSSPTFPAPIAALMLCVWKTEGSCSPVILQKGRSPLSLLASTDNGTTWPWRLDLKTELGEFSYPSIIQATDGILHVVYTHCRTHIQHVVMHPGDIDWQ